METISVIERASPWKWESLWDENATGAYFENNLATCFGWVSRGALLCSLLHISVYSHVPYMCPNDVTRGSPLCDPSMSLQAY